MLVLSRQRDETIMIGDEIEITVVDIRGDKVRLGISAPTRIARCGTSPRPRSKRPWSAFSVRAVSIPRSSGPRSPTPANAVRLTVRRYECD